VLEQAVDAKIADQREFVAWWRHNVNRSGRGNNADHVLIPVSEAEARFGVSQK